MINNLQATRAVAAYMVVVYHLLGQLIYRLYPDAKYLTFGAAGVDIFFVISGFIMVVTTSDGKTGPADFLAKRIGRIVPIYWLITLVLVALVVAGLKPLGIMHMEPDWVVKSLFFIPFDRDGRIEPVNSVGWTLNYEMFFYLVFALCLSVRQNSTRVMLLCAIMLTLTVAGLFGDLGLFGKFYTTPIILEFSFGCALGYFFQSTGKPQLQKQEAPKPDPRGIRISWLLIAIGFTIIAIAQVVTISLGMKTELIGLARPLVWGVGGLFVVTGAVFLERSGSVVSSGWLKKLGDASYSIYLVHGLLVHTSLKLVGLFLPLGIAYLAAICVLGIAASAVVGVLLYRNVELPASRWARARLQRISAEIPAPRLESGR